MTLHLPPGYKTEDRAYGMAAACFSEVTGGLVPPPSFFEEVGA